MSLDDLDTSDIGQRLRTRSIGRSLRVLEVTASTNDDARRDSLAGAHDGHVVVADYQSQGRGSQGRVWESPAGTDLYVSIVSRPSVALHTLPKLTLAVGLGVSHAVDALLASNAGSSTARSQVKWPNDVWVDEHKVAGVLVEASTVGDVISAVIIGIGLNVNRARFSPEISPLATSLHRARGLEQPAFDRAQVLCVLLEHVEACVDRFVADGPEGIITEVNERLALRGRRVTHEGLEGTLLGLAPGGGILIEGEHGVIERVAGRLLPLA